MSSKMNYAIYIRPLLINDALKNYKWSNDPDLWSYAGDAPHKYISMDAEVGWLSYVLGHTTDKCFAICLVDSDQHIGNIELTNITRIDARCNIFIGEKDLWRKGIAGKALQAIIEFAFSYLQLKALKAEIYQDNNAARAVYKKCGFSEEKFVNENFYRLTLKRRNENQQS